MAYAQTDSRWAKILLGYNTDQPFNIGNYGCLITAVANMMTLNNDDTTPVVVNAQFKVNNGFQPGGGIMYWTAPSELNPAIQDHGFNVDLQQVNQWLVTPSNWAIIEVRTKFNTQHFVLGSAVNTIVDSEDGRTKNILTYPFVRARLYSWIEPGKGSGLTPITVSVTKEQEEMISDENHLQALFRAFRPSRNPEGATPEEVKQYVGQSYAGVVEALDQGPERDASVHIVEVGKVAVADNWQGQIETLEAKLTTEEAQVSSLSDQLKAKAQAALAPVAPAVRFPTGIISETPHQITRVTITGGEMVDYGHEDLPTYTINVGTVYHQYSTFTTEAGTSYVRTQKSKDNSQWYGTPEAMFAPVEKPTVNLSAADSAHLAVSKIFGSVGKWLVQHWPFKKKVV